MQANGQQLVNSALTILGLLDQGAGNASVSDSNDVLSELNIQWDAWGIDEGLIYAIQSNGYTLNANIASYPLGPNAGPPFNTPVPSRVYRAFFVLSAGGANPRYPMRIVNEQVYHSHPDLAASALVAEEVYFDWNVDPAAGSINLFLYPVPTCPIQSNLELETGATFSTWTLVGTYDVPQGYYDAIQYALAFRCLPRFGAAVAQQVAEMVAMLGEKAEARIREMNRTNRMLAPGTEAVPQPPQPAAQPAAAR